MSRSLNKVILIGNLTRDPELRYTPAGTAVCTFGLATNRAWKTESGEMKEDAEFHRLVAWNKLAEICAQMLTKGKRTYVEGRIQSRKWTAQDGTEKTTFEVVISDMILLDSRRESDELNVPEDLETVPATAQDSDSAKKVKDKKKEPKKEKENEEDIPF